MRTYEYNQDDLQHLFAKIIEWLGSPDGSVAGISRILAEVCNHFRFGIGFVYEADHTNTFHLKEHFENYEITEIETSFNLESFMTPEELQMMMSSHLFYMHLDEDHLDSNFNQMFQANTFMMVPVLGQNNDFIGLVGMMDRRRNILLDDQAVQAGKMVLNLLANHVKIRIYQRNLEYARQSLVSILDNTGVDVYVTDYNTNEILYVNKTMAAPYGGLEKMLGQKCWKVLYDDKTGPCDYCPQRMLVDDEGNPTKIYSWDYRRPFDGSWFRVLSAAFRWVDGRLAHVISSVDITENKLNEATIAQMANYDVLTNLPNRRKLLNDCEEAIKLAEINNGHGYLLFFDLDNFKALNDKMGHQAGDELLIQLGREMQAEPMTKNHCYRYGGDEFILLYRNVDRSYIRQVVKYLLTRFEKPWKLTGISPICRASIGVAEYPADAASADNLLHAADMNMYQAKNHGRGIAVFKDGEIIRPTTAAGPDDTQIIDPIVETPAAKASKRD